MSGSKRRTCGERVLWETVVTCDVRVEVLSSSYVVVVAVCFWSSSARPRHLRHLGLIMHHPRMRVEPPFPAVTGVLCCIICLGGPITRPLETTP